MPKKPTPKNASTPTAQTPDVFERADGARWEKPALVQTRQGNRWVVRTRKNMDYVDSQELSVPGIDKL